MRRIQVALFLLAGFARAQAPDPAKWYVPTSQAVYLNPDDKILACMKSTQVTSGSNLLSITAAHTASTCSDRNLDGSLRHGPFDLAYSSEQIQSVFSFQYGTLEYSATHPVKSGQWSIVWLMGATSSSANPSCQTTFQFTTDVPFSGCTWPTPPSDEIDVSEYLGTNSYHPQVHSSAGSPTCSTITTEATPTKHAYKMVWSPGSLIFSQDGVTKCTLTGAGVPSTPMFIIVTYLVSNIGFVGNPNPADFPSVFSLDYLKVTQSGTVVFEDDFATPVSPPVVTSDSASGTTGSAFSYSIMATNSPTSYGASGLPAGLSVNTGTGVISGTPTAAGTSSVTMTATNAGGTGTGTLTLTVAQAPPVITSSTTASGTAGTAFSYSITATNSPTSYGATGLPSGLSVNASTGVISGVPASSGTSSVTLAATNAGGTGNATLTITIAQAPPVITSGSTASGTAGSPVSYQITATNAPTSFNASGLPSGLSVNSSTGLISGTPAGAGTSSVTLSATNAGGTGNLTLSLVIAAAPPPPVTPTGQAIGNAVGGGLFR